VTLTFGISKVLYLRHCPGAHNYKKKHMTFKVVQITSQLPCMAIDIVWGANFLSNTLKTI